MDMSTSVEWSLDIAPGVLDIPGDPRESFVEGCMRGREMERMRIARDLHDSTGQLLISLRLSLARLRADPIGPGAADLICELDETVCEIEEQLRTFAFLNFPASLRDDGLVVALQRLSRGFSRKTGLKVEFKNRSSLLAGRRPAALALLRIAQEALTNIYRHAGATSGLVLLEQEGNFIRLKISDNGQGLPIGEPCNGIGLEAMRQRMAAEGGSLTLRRLRRGTRLVAAVPLLRLEEETARKTRTSR
jgi:two-component system, NarL family, sensor kinase